MSDQKQILTDKHKGWSRVWGLILKSPDIHAPYYVHTINDTHVFCGKNAAGNKVYRYAAVHDDDFDVPTGKRVKCTDTGGSDRLILGKVYDVLSESEESYTIRDEQVVGGWYKVRFEVVDAQQSPETRELQEETKPLQPTPPPFDWDTYNGYKKRK